MKLLKSAGWELEVEFTVKGKKKERTKEIDVYVVKWMANGLS